MEEKKFVEFKKNELRIKEYIISSLGKGRISSVNIEYTPIGEKIKVYTSRPGYVIGRKGEKISELTIVLKKRFKLDNPHIEICEIGQPLFDAQFIADEISSSLERQGSLKFKVIAYNTLQKIVKAGALGAEIVLSGKLPSERAKSWRFSYGYLKKTGDAAKLVDRAQAQATTIAGVVGIQVSILKPGTPLLDQINVNDEMLSKIKIKTNDLEENKLQTIKQRKKKNLERKENGDS